MAKQDRREHAVAGVQSGATVVIGGPVNAIEAHASMGNAAKKNLQAFAKPHPSMAGQGNRGHAVTKAMPPAAPINASPATPRPTPAPDVHSGAIGRGSTGADTPGYTFTGHHHPAQGDAVLDNAFDQGAVNNKLPGERHHSTVAPKGAAMPAVSTTKLPSKPADSSTACGGLIAEFKRNNGC